MADSDRRQRVISSAPRLSPEDVASRTFATGWRGYAEAEVRSFLRKLSEELTAAREREQQLLAIVDDLEEQLRTPRPLDEQQLFDALGHETAHLLRSAREAADEIRKKAEERAAMSLSTAEAEAERMHAGASEAAALLSQESEARSAEIIAAAEARAQEVRDANERAAEEQRLAADREAEALVEAARQQGREMLDEARAARERVLSDLARRRGLLQSQVEELRQGRDHLLDAYRVVKRTFLEATEALAQVEARVAAGRPVPSADTADIDAAIAAETDETSETVEVARDDAHVAGAELPGPSAPPPPTGAATQLADVDSLFARIRAGQDEPADAPEPSVDLTDREPAAAAAAPGEPGEGDTAAPAVDRPEPESEAEPGSGPASTAAEAWRRRHADDVGGLAAPLLKRAKRAAQDDQNALLDAVRRHKGRPTAAQVLPVEETLITAWVAVVGGALDEAYRSGRGAAGGDPADAPDELVAEIAGGIVAPVRDRIAGAIDDGDEGDTSGLVERIGARYREWKNQQLESLIGDAIVTAWSRGVYDASADESLLHWIPAREGRCADCDDNALEPTAKGATFPTGQSFPPAHPGCRCLLAPADVLAALPANA